MDTDSAYMALSGPLDSIVREDKRLEFYEAYGDWFPRPYCQDHRTEFVNAKMANREWNASPCCQAVSTHDRRTPGLFKIEFEGDGMVALNSKTYFCWNDTDNTNKLSCKGLSKVSNSLKRDTYKRVLFDKTSHTGANKGFIFKNNRMYTYTAKRSGLTYAYVKRLVLEDGISTTNLSL